jgi:hypothetical protein
VTHVLPVAAGQIGHPIAMLVLVIADNRLVHEAYSEEDNLACYKG